MKRTLIRGGVILTMNAQSEIISDGCVLWEGREILYVGSLAGLGNFHADEVIEAHGQVVMPGLVNAHTHLCMIFGRTLGTSTTLLSWLDIHIPIIEQLDDKAMYTAQLLGCLENLKNGNTTIVENLFAPHTVDRNPADAAFRAMRDSGIRGTVARAHKLTNFRPSFVQTAIGFTTELNQLAETWNGAEGGRLGLSFGPLLPWSTTLEGLIHTRALADRLGIGIHMHVAESPHWNERVAGHYGRPISQVELLHEAGCLGPNVQAVGVADISANDMELLKQTSTSIVFDPQTRLFWGTGFPSILPFIDAGLNCALATNGPAANCGQDLFETMKYACATAKTASGTPTALSARKSLRMATIEGATAIGLGQSIGSLEPGKLADVITVDVATARFTPAHDIEAALVFCARGADVRHVFVDGMHLVRDGRAAHIDEAALINEAGQMSRAAVNRAFPNTDPVPES